MGGRAHANDRRARGEFTFTEAARREQLIDLTIDLIAEHGFARTTLAKIAAAAELSNAAVLYFFGAKNAVLLAAGERVMSDVIETVATAVSDAPTAREGIDAYVRAIVGHMVEHPSHTRVMIELLTQAPPDLVESVTGTSTPQASRWRPVAELIERAQLDGELRTFDARTAAIGLIGATDAVFAESLNDPDYDLRTAVDELLDLFDRSTAPEPDDR